ncbi:hypothetical protein COY33_01850 [candidate division WWE3 bacterium CG_4_10_14_0_2_um_filter_42_7]|uniref:Uncharacterized protein n=2 Tax=Katanobacteria TaxID=422282 RepID=A0A2H0X8D5_UNCKA|nr:MAG: hypothetical protein COT51_04025 [candidate division WWE3 bacterium CG08_land_8_20_14_0_20_41_15]PIZ43234.1 MAG: hypothetical protein COY33_01850 [candidate division WWE3 bacterium CG_4_10_14_0_2_um_filter_42_7]
MSIESPSPAPVENTIDSEAKERYDFNFIVASRILVCHQSLKSGATAEDRVKGGRAEEWLKTHGTDRTWSPNGSKPANDFWSTYATRSVEAQQKFLREANLKIAFSASENDSAIDELLEAVPQLGPVVPSQPAPPTIEAAPAAEAKRPPTLKEQAEKIGVMGHNPFANEVSKLLAGDSRAAPFLRLREVVVPEKGNRIKAVDLQKVLSEKFVGRIKYNCAQKHLEELKYSPEGYGYKDEPAVIYYKTLELKTLVDDLCRLGEQEKANKNIAGRGLSEDPAVERLLWRLWTESGGRAIVKGYYDEDLGILTGDEEYDIKTRRKDRPRAKKNSSMDKRKEFRRALATMHLR